MSFSLLRITTKLSSLILLFLIIVFLKLNNATASECYEKDLTQTEINKCVNNKANESEIELEITFKELLSKTAEDNRKKLEIARKHWNEFRQQQCDFNSLGNLGGTVHSMVVSECYIYLTNQYISLLKEQLHCQEGNLSCGGQ